jgi:alpha-L-fucosidase
MKRALVPCFVAFSVGATATSAADVETARALARWQAMRFGMFIHWGPVALKGTEIGWSRGKEVPVEEYDQLYTRFNAVRFDADAWVRAARDAGMRYVVLTTRHHDGFCLWPSSLTDYHVGRTPFGRDVMRELADACRRHGLELGTYYSICDWRHPDYPLGSPGGQSRKPSPNMPRFASYVRGQTRELIERYGPLGVMWFDGEWEEPWTRGDGNALYAELKAIQPTLLINNRVSKGRAGMAGVTMDRGLNAGDFDTPEQRLGAFDRDHPWESCITLCQQWAWKPDDALKSLEETLRTLVSCAGGDGNLLLNVGPTAEGEIEPRQVARLREIGGFLARFGESIYGTRGGPFKPGRWGASTHIGDRVYLHVWEWDGDGISVAPFGRTIRACRSLTGGSPKLTATAAGTRISLPEAERHPIDSVLVLELDGAAWDVEPRELTGPVADRRETAARKQRSR